MKPPITEALRMMGHLLETNGTIGGKAILVNGATTWNYRNSQACAWCLVGATDLVFDTLFGHEMEDERYEIVENFLGISHEGCALVDAWEPTPPKLGRAARKAIVEKLKNA